MIIVSTREKHAILTSHEFCLLNLQSYHNEFAKSWELKDRCWNDACNLIVAEVKERDDLHEGDLGADCPLHPLACRNDPFTSFQHRFVSSFEIACASLVPWQAGRAQSFHKGVQAADFVQCSGMQVCEGLLPSFPWCFLRTILLL